MTDKKCYYCPATDELRPYGPGGSYVCYPCATETPERNEQSVANFHALLFAAEAISENNIVILDSESEAGPQPL